VANTIFASIGIMDIELFVFLLRCKLQQCAVSIIAVEENKLLIFVTRVLISSPKLTSQLTTKKSPKADRGSAVIDSNPPPKLKTQRQFNAEDTPPRLLISTTRLTTIHHGILIISLTCRSKLSLFEPTWS
jgi:hypothetical protein